MKLLIRIQIVILAVQIFFLQNEIENGFITEKKLQKLQSKKLIKSILKSFIKTGNI
jgi:hypothetical protein